MNRASTLLSAAAFAVAGLVTSHGIADAADKVFALVPKNMNNPFFDQARDGCMKAAKEIGGIECYYIGPGEHGGGDEQFQMVQDLIAKKVDGLAVSVANAPAIAKAAAAAKAAGIPMVTWDSDLLPNDKALRATYIGTVNTEIGKEIGQAPIALKPNGGTYCIQSGGPAAVEHERADEGMLETIPADKWKQVDGCPLYNNDDFPLSIVPDDRHSCQISEAGRDVERRWRSANASRGLSQLTAAMRTASSQATWSFCSWKRWTSRWAS